jgi:DNA-binding IclR family transcriptional regulator
MPSTPSSGKKSKEPAAPAPGGGWTFLTNHAHVLILLAGDPGMLLREVAATVGVTERAVQKIVAELEAGGVLTREREGRRNHYRIHRQVALRHPIEAHRTVGHLLKAILAK